MSVKRFTVYTITCDRCGATHRTERGDTLERVKVSLGYDGWTFFTTDKSACGRCVSAERSAAPGFIGELQESA